MIVDLRSDTVTRPTAAMRKAMAEAEVGDDVFGDDPTVKRLEAAVAERLGKEAALYVPSGTMANQIAIRLHTRPGDEVLMEHTAHPFNYEAGAPAVISGVQIRPLPGADGILDPNVVAAAIRPIDDHFAPATLLSVEDTSNRGGGSVHPLDRLDALATLAKGRGLRTHLDGARLFNAAVASNTTVARRAQHFDTVSVCFSKGLGAPVGSAICGPKDAITLGRRVRKMLGGGMRQVGIIAAGALHALEHHVARLADDHARARALAMGLMIEGYDIKSPQTNMVYVTIGDALAKEAALQAKGVLCKAVAPDRIRLVLHLDVDDAGVEHTIAAFRALR